MRTIMLIVLTAVALAAAGCQSPQCQHAVIPGAAGQPPRVVHLQPGWIVNDHGCDSSSIYRP